MAISQQKVEELNQRMQRLGIREEDLIEKFILGSGRGGQKLQKTASCVYLKHIPTGIELKCSRDRSREANRFFARRELCDRIDTKPKEDKINKIRKQKKRRDRRRKLPENI